MCCRRQKTVIKLKVKFNISEEFEVFFKLFRNIEFNLEFKASLFCFLQHTGQGHGARPGQGRARCRPAGPGPGAGQAGSGQRAAGAATAGPVTPDPGQAGPDRPSQAWGWPGEVSLWPRPGRPRPWPLMMVFQKIMYGSIDSSSHYKLTYEIVNSGLELKGTVLNLLQK